MARRQVKPKNDKQRDELQSIYNNQVDQLQEAAKEFASLSKQVEECDIDNVIHAAKIMRIADEHDKKAQRYRAKMAHEGTKMKR